MTNKRNQCVIVLFVIAIMLMALLLCPAIVNAKETEIEKERNINNINVVCDDGEYYSETTYYYNQGQFASLYALSSIEDNEEFVMGVSKKVWVAETKNDEGLVADSRLLKKDELRQGDFETQVSAQSSYIGEDEEARYSLEIALTVVESNGVYTAKAVARWENKAIWGGEQTAEESRDDYLGLTWGGEGTLEKRNQSFTGVYYDGSTMNGSRALSDSYKGYVWQFREKTWFWGTMMKKATANVSISKVGTNEGKSTSIKLTYIHTYKEVNGTISFSYQNHKVVPQLTIGQKDNNWQIQVDVAGIRY